MIVARRGWVLAIAAALAASALPVALLARPAEESARPAGAGPAADQAPLWVGSGKCSGRGCHGGVGPEGSKGCEYTTWTGLDKHADAYTVLFNKRSQLIEKDLKHLAKLEDAHAEKDELCLKCHDRPRVVDPGDALRLMSNGVGCESCHGPAGKWLVPHAKPEWQSLKPSEKRDKYQMTVLDSAADRAATCVVCHVGAPDREVNHDLIAAGHPRLNFELGAFLADMPKHWDADDVARKKKSQGRPPGSEAETWAVGQVATVQASLDLLAHRASAEDAPWPEFTEYGCFACHHDLRDAGIRYGRPGRLPGALPWAAWQLPLFQPLASQGGAPEGVSAAIDRVDALMSVPYPDRKAVAKEAGDASKSLAQWLQGLQAKGWDSQALRKLLTSLTPEQMGALTANWDGATQLYLAGVALLQDDLGRLGEGQAPDQRLKDLQSKLDEVAKALAFPRGQDSPGIAYDPENAKKEFDELLKLLGP
jgi:hypothetical protein